MNSGLTMSGRAARWGLRFYAAHLPLVLGLSLIPTVQRFYSVSEGEDLPGAVGVAGEAVTGVARILLFVLVVSRMAREPEMARIPAPQRWNLLGAAMRRRLGDLAVAAVLLAAAFVVFDTLPGIAVDRWVPAAHRDVVTAALVAVKNPTVIAFTILWLLGIARVLIVEQHARTARPEPAAPRA